MTDDAVARWSAWDRFVAATPDAGFMQSSPWAQFRARAGYEHFAVTLKDGDAIVGGALVGKWTYEPGHCFYYVQEGPVLPADEADAAEVFDAVLASIERHRKAEDATVSHLRIEPRWQHLPDFVRGFRPAALSERYSEPRDTLCIDLRPSEEEILAQMKPKGRYNVRVARKHGVTIVRDNSYQGLIDFMRIQRCTLVRKGMKPMTPVYFRAMLTELLPRGQASLFFAEHRGRRLATALVVTFGRRATYLYGGSLLAQRRVMAPSLLHFEIMRRAKASGCEWYDLWGVAPFDQPDHAWQQISEFKRKLGGVEVQLVPTLDYVYDAAAYDQYRIAESGRATSPRTMERPPASAPPSDTSDTNRALASVRLFDPAVPRREFNALRRAFPESHFRRLLQEGFRFYQTAFWYPLDRGPENVFESIINSLRPLAQPSASVIGVEWWFSVTLTNSTPQWLLPCHFDRNDLDEQDLQKIRHPETASVLFLTSPPYGELVVTDQVLTDKGAHPQQPKDMRFVSPKANRYATFPGHLYHGVIGRMWRPVKDTKLRVAMAVNWWTQKPEAAYLNDSRACMAALQLTTPSPPSGCTPPTAAWA
ncbi:lipid II:glycine glycyltransferase FemX [Caenimonas soli]|uniref:lipid II:glycine glycyltransferase FemX n=1 Tax=Caenimonas soli TaxID=2735555 RepID=UPI0015546316|nr:peptidoglycan bridge formation glycyltransferase FemA/FemB family protein [Caenimonas soli]NPC57450.1 peptidoglycan bridge formation glycyltransferase FemA/FemB family protein [Caenimonas soli]